MVTAKGLMWTILGCLMALAGIGCYFAMPAFLGIAIKQHLILGRDPDGSLNWAAENWARPQYDNIMSFHFLHWTNPWAMILGYEDKPSVHRVGPYSYVQYDLKHNISFTDDGYYVNYKNYRTWYWRQDKSCATCDKYDTVTVPNTVYLGAAPILATQLNITITVTLPITHKRVDITLDLASIALTLLGEYPYKTAKVNELLFEGYDDPILSINARLPPQIRQTGAGYNPKLAFFYGYNRSDDGFYNVDTGRKVAGDIGTVRRWMDKEHLPRSWWRYVNATQLLGSDVGSFQPPDLTKDETLHVFLSYWCRSIPLHYTSDETVNGIDTWRFAISPQIYNWSLPQNQGFAADPKVDKDLPDGMMVLPCLPGKMASMPRETVYSAPNFQNCAPEVQSTVRGMYPQPENTYMGYYDLQPDIGMPLRVRYQLQVNIPIWPNDTILMLQRLRKSIYQPMHYSDSHILIDQNTQDIINTYLIDVPFAVKFIMVSFALAGMLIAIWPFVGPTARRMLATARRRGNSEAADDELLLAEMTSEHSSYGRLVERAATAAHDAKCELCRDNQCFDDGHPRVHRF